MCEVSLACDNLLCDGHGRPPNPVLEVDVQLKRSKTWIKYARTEVVEVSIFILISNSRCQEQTYSLYVFSYREVAIQDS